MRNENSEKKYVIQGHNYSRFIQNEIKNNKKREKKSDPSLVLRVYSVYVCAVYMYCVYVYNVYCI